MAQGAGVGAVIHCFSRGFMLFTTSPPPLRVDHTRLLRCSAERESKSTYSSLSVRLKRFRMSWMSNLCSILYQILEECLYRQIIQCLFFVNVVLYSGQYLHFDRYSVFV